jgi:FkbM family methyltransferase
MMWHAAKRGISALSYVGYRAAESEAFRRMAFNAIRLRRTEAERFMAMEECRFLAYCFLKRSESRSQILQDLWVSYELRERRDGFFVEFGATNGVTNSNTWLLENKYSWRGILAEPNPVWHSDLARSRNVSIDHRCVSSNSGDVVSFLATDGSDPELSAIAAFSDGDHFAEIRAEGAEIKVETVSLDQLLADHHAPERIDYLSIDTEGNEYDILSHFDFSRHMIDLVSVEQNARTEPMIEALLLGHGYRRVFKEFSQWDGWYVRADRGS